MLLLFKHLWTRVAMQGLAHYAEYSPSPSPPHPIASSSRTPASAAPSSRSYNGTNRYRRRSNSTDDQAGAAGPSSHPTSLPTANLNSVKHNSPPRSNPSHTASPAPIAGPSRPITGTAKKRRKLSPRSTSNPGTPLPENLTHTRQSDLPHTELSGTRVSRDEAAVEEGGIAGFPGLSEDEVFRIITRPPDIPGVVDWGIPPAVDSSLAPDALKTKVANFLRLKYERDQHINTTLLSSSAFANPHIYAKLVEFVQIDETATAFPGGGWVTRRNLEGERSTYGPAALSAAQKVKEDAVRKSQEVGKRRAIEFAKGKYRDGDRRKDRYGDGDRDRDRDGRRDGGGHSRGEGRRDRDRDRFRR